MKYRICMIAIVLVVLVTGMAGSWLAGPDIVCRGDDCCVDQNENKVCDAEEPLIELPAPPGRMSRWS